MFMSTDMVLVPLLCSGLAIQPTGASNFTLK